MLKGLLVLVITGSGFCAGALSQPTHNHIIESARIDGKDHPEQIPDHLAYGLFLKTISLPASPTDDQKLSQAVHLRMIGLSGQDSQAVVPILASFHEQRRKLIDDYNVIATDANSHGRNPDPDVRAIFFRNLNSLVMTTRDNLKSTLSPQGWERLDGHIQNSWKRGMTIPASEGVK